MTKSAKRESSSLRTRLLLILLAAASAATFPTLVKGRGIIDLGVPVARLEHGRFCNLAEEVLHS